MDYKRVNMDLTEKDWCTYTGTCNKGICTKNDLCVHCKYKKQLDIPKMIEEKMEITK